jgi:hypothetical protein
MRIGRLGIELIPFPLPVWSPPPQEKDMPAPTFTVEFLDGRVEKVKLTPRAQVDYEAATGKPLTGMGGGDRPVSEMYELAWYAAGKPDTYDTWLDGLEAILSEAEEQEAEESEARPT